MTSGAELQRRVFRLPRSAYFAVLLLLFGISRLAFNDGVLAIGPGTSQNPSGSTTVFGWQTFLLLIPALVGVFIWRWATIVDADGITVRVAFGKRLLAWDRVRGLSVSERSVYLVTDDGAWRLPCVHVNDLGTLSRASGGRLPEIDDPTPKYAPQPRRRGR